MTLQVQNFKYHLEIVNKISENRTVWEWFNKQEDFQPKQDEILLAIEKNNYRIGKQEMPELYKALENACIQLDIAKPCQLYQTINKADNNAQIIELEHQLLILFSGETLNLLTLPEIKAILYHELGHMYFNRQENCRFELTNRIIQTFANNNDNQKTYSNTCINFQLYIELFCDRVSAQISKKPEELISALIKIHTGLKDVSVNNYISQAENIIFNNHNIGTKEESHPELFIRCYALANINNEKLDSILNSHILGSLDIDNLDIIEQTTLQYLTKRLIVLFIEPNCTKIPEIENMAKLYFPNLDHPRDLNLKINNLNLHENTKQYLSYVLLDFCLSHQELKDEFLWQGKIVSETLDIYDSFIDTLKKELNLSQKELDSQFIRSKKEFEILNTNL